MFFLYFARPAHKFSNGPSLTTRTVRECGRQRSKVKPSGVKTLLLHSRALRKFHVIDGQTTRDQITSERTVKTGAIRLHPMHSIHSYRKSKMQLATHTRAVHA